MWYKLPILPILRVTVLMCMSGAKDRDMEDNDMAKKDAAAGTSAGGEEVYSRSKQETESTHPQ